MDPQLATKKFVASLTREGYASSRSIFVVPAFDGSPWFVDLLTGKRHDSAYLVFLGRSITAEDVLRRIEGQTHDSDNSRGLVNSLIQELQRFKVGNVVAVEHSDGQQVRLRLIAMTPKSKPGPTLPGSNAEMK